MTSPEALAFLKKEGPAALDTWLGGLVGRARTPGETGCGSTGPARSRLERPEHVDRLGRVRAVRVGGRRARAAVVGAGRADRRRAPGLPPRGRRSASPPWRSPAGSGSSSVGSRTPTAPGGNRWRATPTGCCSWGCCSPPPRRTCSPARGWRCPPRWSAGCSRSRWRGRCAPPASRTGGSGWTSLSPLWFGLHLGGVYAGTAAAAVAAGAGAAWLLAERRLKHRAAGWAAGLGRFASLERLEALTRHAAIAGFVTLSIGLSAGVVISAERPDLVGLLLSPKLVLSLLAYAAFVVAVFFGTGLGFRAAGRAAARRVGFDLRLRAAAGGFGGRDRLARRRHGRGGHRAGRGRGGPVNRVLALSMSHRAADLALRERAALGAGPGRASAGEPGRRGGAGRALHVQPDRDLRGSGRRRGRRPGAACRVVRGLRGPGGGTRSRLPGDGGRGRRGPPLPRGPRGWRARSSASPRSSGR